MKKTISLLLSLIMFCGITVHAKIGDIIGRALNTDIVVYINNYAIPSFAVDGSSCIVAEDLRNFGFDVIWDDISRSLSIKRNKNILVNPMSVTKDAKAGGFFADLLETDIAVYASGISVTSYAMNGYTIIPVEELTMFGNVYWIENERALKLWVEGLHIREAMQPITRRQNDTSAYSAFNGIYVGGGISVPGSIYSIGQWSAVLSNVTEDSMHLSFGQSESDYGVIMTLYRQPNGSYCGYGQPDGWEGYSYITIWIESNNRISLTVSGTADSIGTEILYRSNNF